MKEKTQEKRIRKCETKWKYSDKIGLRCQEWTSKKLKAHKEGDTTKRILGEYA